MINPNPNTALDLCDCIPAGGWTLDVVSTIVARRKVLEGAWSRAHAELTDLPVAIDLDNPLASYPAVKRNWINAVVRSHLQRTWAQAQTHDMHKINALLHTYANNLITGELSAGRGGYDYNHPARVVLLEPELSAARDWAVRAAQETDVLLRQMAHGIEQAWAEINRRQPK